MDGAQNPVYYPPEFVHVQTVLGMARHELEMKAIAIDVLGQEFEPKEKVLCNGEKRVLNQGKTWQNFKGRNFKRSLHRI
jgi:hypothetical protein